MSRFGILGRKFSVAAAAQQSPPSSENNVIELDEEIFAPTATQLGTDNEALRNLLSDAGYKIGELDAIKEAFGKLVDPVTNALRSYESEKREKLSLQTLLNNSRTAYSKLRNELGAVEAKAAAIEAECAKQRGELQIAQQNLRATEESKIALTDELNHQREQIAELMRNLQQNANELHVAREESRRLSERIVTADNRVVDLEAGSEALRHKLALSEKERSLLQAKLDEALGESGRISRRLLDAESSLTSSQTRMRQMEANLRESEAEQARLAAALDDTTQRHQTELNTQRMRFESLQSRAATTDKLLDEARHALKVRNEESCAADRRLAEASFARQLLESKLSQTETAVAERDAHIADVERAYTSISERNEALVNAVKMRDQAINRAEEQRQSINDRIGLLEAEIKASRQAAEQRIEELNTALHREQIERSMADGAVEAGRKEIAGLMRQLALLQNSQGTGVEVRRETPGRYQSAA